MVIILRFIDLFGIKDSDRDVLTTDLRNSTPDELNGAVRETSCIVPGHLVVAIVMIAVKSLPFSSRSYVS